MSQKTQATINFLFIFALLTTHLLAAKKPNVVIVYTDDQGTLDANCYGSKDLYTPNIDRLAKKGVRFTQAYAHTVCCPSRAALLTGRHPQRSGVNNWTQGNLKAKQGINMSLKEVTLAEALKQNGYRTALFGKWHLGAHQNYGPTKQGFDEFFGHRGGFIDNYNHHFLHGHGFHDLYEGTNEVFARDKYFPEMVVDRSLKFIEQNKNRPFFLYLALNTPHYPEQALAKFSKRYEKLKMPRRSYAAMISTTDHYLGQVLNKLDELKLTNDMIVIFMSDNGASAERSSIRVDNHKSGLRKGHNYGANGGGGNMGKWQGHKGTFLEGGIRVPAIISYPAVAPQGEVRNQIITAMDWYPTIVKMASLKETKTKFDGQNILPIIKSKDASSPHKVLYFQWQSRWAVRRGDWKLISQRNKLRLYNLADEKPETIDYQAKKPEVAKELQALHARWLKEVSAK